MLKTEQGTFSSTEDDSTASSSDCSYSSATMSVDYSVITVVSPIYPNPNDYFSAGTSGGCSRHADLMGRCYNILETGLLLFESSFDLFPDDARGPHPKVSGRIEPVINAETIDGTPKETPKTITAQSQKKKSALKRRCLKTEQARTLSIVGDVTAELSLTPEQGKRVAFFESTVNNAFQCDPEDGVQVEDKICALSSARRTYARRTESERTVVGSGVDFSEVTVRTFACRFGDNPSVSKCCTNIVKHVACVILNPSLELSSKLLFLLLFLLSGSGVPITISGKPLSTKTVDINKYEKFVGSNRRKGNELLLSPQERSKMLLEAGYSLEEIIKIIIETEHGKDDRLESMAKEQRRDNIRSMLSPLRASFWVISM